MENIAPILHTISAGGYDHIFSRLYRESTLPHHRERYCRLLETFAKTFPQAQTPRLFSAPGRTDSTLSAMEVIVTSAADVGSRSKPYRLASSPKVIRLFMDSLTALTFPPLRV